jgi:hypothetical protein
MFSLRNLHIEEWFTCRFTSLVNKKAQFQVALKKILKYTLHILC